MDVVYVCMYVCMYVCDLSLSICIISVYPYLWVSLVAQMVKNLPEMQETWVWSLNCEDSLEKGMATHSIFWPGEFHDLYSPWGSKESDTTEQLWHFIQASFNFMAAVTFCSDFGAPENKICYCFPLWSFHLPWSNGTGCHDISFLNIEL